MLKPVMKDNLEKPYWFSKDKCPRGLSYPLKRSNLDAALVSADVYAAVYSVRFLATRSRVFLGAQFSPLGIRVHQDVIGRSLLTLHALPSEHRHQIEDMILTQTLPVLCQWLRKTQTQGDSWRAMHHSIAFELGMNNMVRTIEDQT
jgi:hypothetical protein